MTNHLATAPTHPPAVGDWLQHPTTGGYGLVHALSHDADRVGVLWTDGGRRLLPAADVHPVTPAKLTPMGLASRVITHLNRCVEHANARTSATQDRADANAAELARLRRQLASREQLLAQCGTELAEQAAHHQHTLDAIRDYAIERHHAGDICREGLDAFLGHFGLSPIQADYEVRFAVVLTLSATDQDHAYDLARGAMGTAARGIEPAMTYDHQPTEN